jgi:hypothetical protein
MANSDTLLIWMIYVQFALFLLPGIAWLADRAYHSRVRKPPMAWSGNRLHSHRSRFTTYHSRSV